MHGLNHAVVRQPTFSIRLDGKVFLCLPDAEKGPQLRSRSLVSLRRAVLVHWRQSTSPLACDRSERLKRSLVCTSSVASLPAASLDDPFDRPQEKT